MAFYDFYTNNVGKKEFIETIEPQKPPLTRFCIGRLLWPSMAFYDFYTNNVVKKEFIETIDPQNPPLTRFCIGRLLWTAFYGLL
jgi:hypothetical protein